MRPCDVINVQMREKKSELVDKPVQWLLVFFFFLTDKRSDRLDSSVEHSQFIFYLYDRVEYLAQRCDYATGWSAPPPPVIKEDISGEKK